MIIWGRIAPPTPKRLITCSAAPAKGKIKVFLRRSQTNHRFRLYDLAALDAMQDYRKPNLPYMWGLTQALRRSCPCQNPSFRSVIRPRRRTEARGSFRWIRLARLSILSVTESPFCRELDNIPPQCNSSNPSDSNSKLVARRQKRRPSLRSNGRLPPMWRAKPRR